MFGFIKKLTIICSPIIVNMVAMEPPRKKQKVYFCHNYHFLKNAFLYSDFEKLQEAIESGSHLHFNISYSENIGLIVVELFASVSADKNKEKQAFKHSLFFESEAPLIPRIKYLLLNKYSVALEEINEDNVTWQQIAPTLAKLMILIPNDPETFALDPEQYKKDHPDEFDPVLKFPKDFDEEINILCQWNCKKICKQYGSVFNYLQQRELDVTHNTNIKLLLTGNKGNTITK